MNRSIDNKIVSEYIQQTRPIIQICEPNITTETREAYEDIKYLW